jgi:hypothetical protein
MATPEVLKGVADAFLAAEPDIGSSRENQLRSNAVLAAIRPHLEARSFIVEKPGALGRVAVPVLWGENGRVDKSFNVDAWNRDRRTVVEIEAGRAVDSQGFLKDLFEASAMPEVEYACIAVMNEYWPDAAKNTGRPKRNYDQIMRFLEVLFASQRFVLPLKGIMLIGY